MEETHRHTHALTFQKHKIRTVQRDGFFGFVNSDICQALGISSKLQAVMDTMQELRAYPKEYAEAISDSGWGEFVRQLEYKSTWKGGYVFKIGTFFPSSKTCNKCKHINSDLKLSDRLWTCPNCGAILDRDINAALNILEEATAGAAGI